jgi:hypothetical protein
MADAENALSRGLYALLEPVVLQTDQKIQDVFASQTALAREIEQLSAGRR